MDETLLLYWVGYFTATGIILSVGLYVWLMILCTISDIINRTYDTYRGIKMVATARDFLKKGEVVDAAGVEWKIRTVDKNKMIFELKDDRNIDEW
jgi:hypothetical protein